MRSILSTVEIMEGHAVTLRHPAYGVSSIFSKGILPDNNVAFETIYSSNASVPQRRGKRTNGTDRRVRDTK